MEPTDEEIRRFWPRVRYAEESCWEWAGGRNEFRYGICRIGGRSERAHRVSWAMWNGPIPNGLSVLHSCDNPPCVNPDHLFLGTQRENLEDMTRKGRRRSGKRDQKGEANGYAKLTREQVAHIRGMALAGHYQDTIATKYGIDRANVSQIARGHTWRDVQPLPYPPAVRNRPVGRSAPRRRAEMGL